MRSASAQPTSSTRANKPRALTVFAAAFVAGAAAAVAVNSVLDVRLAQAKPKVESEPIFVALRSLPQGAPVTVWDVALRDWPRAMVPTSALRASDTFSGLVLKQPLREGQPLLAIQLAESDTRHSAPVSVTAIPASSASVARAQDTDLWAPAEPIAATPAATPPQPQPAPTATPRAEPIPADPTPEVARSDAPAVVPVPTAPVAAVTEPNPPTSSAPIAEVPRRPSPDDAAATVAPSSDPVPMPAAASVAADASVGGDPAIGFDAATDEMLEALAAAVASPSESVVTPPADGVIAAAVPQADGDAAPLVAPAVPADAVTIQPAPTPTLADPPQEEPATVGGVDAAGPASVMRQPATDAEAAPAPAQRPARVAQRYLVIPESIALQADASFSAPRQPDPTPTPSTNSDHIKPLPPTTATPAGRPAQQRASQPRRGTSATVPPASHGAGAAQQSRRGSVFPNIAAGIDSLEGEFGRMRRDRPAQAEPTQAPRPRLQY